MQRKTPTVRTEAAEATNALVAATAALLRSHVEKEDQLDDLISRLTIAALTISDLKSDLKSVQADADGVRSLLKRTKDELSRERCAHQNTSESLRAHRACRPRYVFHPNTIF